MFELYDTLTRKKREIKAGNGKTLRFYCCGPTVYGPAHVGNFRTFLVQDLFRRVAELSGFKTKHVRNVTDVDDKTIRQSQAEGKSLTAFTQYWTERFHADCEKLNLLQPHVEPSAVAHIKEQIEMIEKLIEDKNAYQGKDGSVYFSIRSFKDYGKLARLDQQELISGAAQSANNSDEYTKDAINDFALWKAHRQEDGENYWDSPWGKGRPGWHLECSAMSLKYLGNDFDLHSGGVDLIFPHHENEIAQSECFTGQRFCRHWLHVAHLMVDGGKMSKSLGNLYTVADIEAKGFHPAELRYVLLSGDYRQPLNFTWDSLHAAWQALGKTQKVVAKLLQIAELQKLPAYKEQLKARVSDLGLFAQAWEALQMDMNAPKALGHFFTALKQVDENLKQGLSSKDAILVLSQLAWILNAIGLEIPERKEAQEQAPEEVKTLAMKRWQAKQAKDWNTADKLRDEIASLGWTIKDRKDGFDLIKNASAADL
ncbi:MAG: cysteine--tRNA ligase [Verrucomicrobiota bacterium]